MSLPNNLRKSKLLLTLPRNIKWSLFPPLFIFVGKTNFCNSNPCLYGNPCIPIPNNYTCNCTGTFYGRNCQNNSNHCWSNPCQNGGTCVQTNTSDTSYICLCPNRTSGETCQNATILPPVDCFNVSLTELCYNEIGNVTDICYSLEANNVAANCYIEQFEVSSNCESISAISEYYTPNFSFESYDPNTGLSNIFYPSSLPKYTSYLEFCLRFYGMVMVDVYSGNTTISATDGFAYFTVPTPLCP